MNAVMKKGQGLSLNTIVIAALALIVLVVISWIFLRNAQEVAEDIPEVTKTKCYSTTLRIDPTGDCYNDEREFYADFKPKLAPGAVCCQKKSATSSVDRTPGVGGD